MTTAHTTSNFEMITTSQSLVTRLNYAHSDMMHRRRKRTIEVLTAVTKGYWSHGDHGVLCELGEDLARALLHIIESAQSSYNIGALIEGIERAMYTAPKQFDHRNAEKRIMLRVQRFEHYMGVWTYIGDIRSFDYEPFGGGEEESEPEEDEFDGYYPESVRQYQAMRPEHDADALREFGAAIATFGWRHDPQENGLGSPLMVLLIAYLRALEPPRDPINREQSTFGRSYTI